MKEPLPKNKSRKGDKKPKRWQTHVKSFAKVGKE